MKDHPIAEANIQPTWFIWDTCPWLIEAMPAMQHDEHWVEDVLKVDADSEGKNGDDAYDSARYGVMDAKTHVKEGISVTY